MRKKTFSKFRQITCPMQLKRFLLSDEDKVCPCCGELIDGPEENMIGHYLYEEEVTVG